MSTFCTFQFISNLTEIWQLVCGFQPLKVLKSGSKNFNLNFLYFSDAQYAISQLHRKKIGYKRILIARNDVQSHNPMLLRTKVISLLNEVPGSKLQLFKFREMYEKRYHDSIGVADLYKMKDVVVITEEASGKNFSELSQFFYL